MEVDPKPVDSDEDMDVDVCGLVIDIDEQEKKTDDQNQEDEDQEANEEEETEESSEEAEPEEGIYQVKKIMGMQIFGRTLKYKVRWEGYSSDDDTWEPASNLIGEGAQKLLKAYREKYKENVERLEGHLRGYTAKQTGAPKSGWKYIDADDIETGEDRELTLNDDFYDQSVAELKGEKKHLVDLSKRVTHNERYLAELGSRDRITRKTLRELKGDGVSQISPSPSPVGTPPTSRKPSISGVSARKQSAPIKKRKVAISSTSSTSSAPFNNNERETKPVKKRVTPVTKLFSAKEPDVLSCLDDAIGSAENEERTRSSAGRDPSKKSKRKKYQELAPSMDFDDDVFTTNQLDHIDDVPDVRMPIVDLPVIKHVDLDALLDHPSPQKRIDPPVDFMEAVMSGDAQNFLHLEHVMSPEKFAENCVFTEPETGMNCLHKLCAMPCDLSHGVCDIVGIICKTAGKGLLSQQNFHEKTPLHIAVVNGFPCRMRVLLRYGAPLNIADNYGKTPVDSAYCSNNPDVWKAMLRVGANYTRMLNQPNREIIPSQEDILNEHSVAVSQLLKATRAKVLYGSRELCVLSPVITSPFHDGPQFIFHVDYKEGSLPGCAVIKLMCFVCSFYGEPENWTARCWGGLHMCGHPKLNGVALVPACDDNYPMIYHCPLKNGRNQISITCANADSNSLVFATQVVAFDPMGGQQTPAFPSRFG